ncbi:MAG: GIY-YIG nuclease family protein [Anaerolineales bacterium]|jgi:putative endonuclease
MTSFCYILECADGSYYTGWSNDPERRLRVHNAGRGARYTRSRRPVRLVYVEELPDRASAMRRERQIKGLTKKQKEKLIQQFSPKFRNGDAQERNRR